MKQSYSTPTAEKLDFNYTETVTASDLGVTGTVYSDMVANCGQSVAQYNRKSNGQFDFMSGI